MILGSKSNQLHLGPIFFYKITNKHNCHFHIHIGPWHRTRMVYSRTKAPPQKEPARKKKWKGLGVTDYYYYYFFFGQALLNRMQKRCMYGSEGMLF